LVAAEVLDSGPRIIPEYWGVRPVTRQATPYSTRKIIPAFSGVNLVEGKLPKPRLTAASIVPPTVLAEEAEAKR
jgi:hypothetical protein